MVLQLVSERERERERERDTHTHRLTDRQTETDRQTDRQRVLLASEPPEPRIIESAPVHTKVCTPNTHEEFVRSA